jgi:hypothetical protein
MKLGRRIAKLEARFGARGASFPTLVFGQAGRCQVDVIGGTANGITVSRNPGEAVNSLVVRCGRELREKILFLTYAEGRTGDTVVVFPQEQLGSIFSKDVM